MTLRGSGVDPYGQAFDDALLTVTVGQYVATDPASVTVGVGSTVAEVQAAAPASVPGQIGDGPARNPLPVTWDWASLVRLRTAVRGSVTVPGTAGSLSATLTVLVVDRVPSSNICKDDPTTVCDRQLHRGLLHREEHL